MAATLVEDRVRQRGPASLALGRPEVGALVGALVICALFLLVAEPFRNVANVGTILYGASTIGMMAVPVALLMIGGEFDLSTGVAITTSGLTAALFAWYFGLNVWVGVALALVMSLAIGAFNAWLLLKTGLPSFLVTLGTFFILQGLNLGITRAISGGVASPRISDMAGFPAAEAVFGSQVSVFGIFSLRVTVLFWLLLTLAATWVLLRTRVGNWIFASGGDPAAARAVGVPVAKTKVGLYLFVGFCAWLSGMHLLFGYGTVQSGEGIGKEFVFIIAAVIGGCLLTGGYGSVIGASIGALIFGMTQLGINYAGWNPDWFRAFLGAMLLIATIVNLQVKKRAEAR